MPELPEVQTTVNGLQKVLPGQIIQDVWTDLASEHKMHAETLKDTKYFKTFKNKIVGEKILSVTRRAKNILINLSNDKSIIVHMKMTGHLLHGKYEFDKHKNKWTATEKGPLRDDPYNRFIHAVFTLSPSDKVLAFSDTRKFGKIALIQGKDHSASVHLKNIGPDPLDADFTPEVLGARLKNKPNGKIKTVLMDLTVIAGIGNIYSDEILWCAGIHPESRVKDIPQKYFPLMHKYMIELLKKGIDFGGDSMSDYRNIHGERGKFQSEHNAYRLTGKPCKKKSCAGVIVRKVIGGRSAHFCDTHQILFK
jgi:formamidopyrimidine-DNA glycosylase